jgi:hypothetical protein
MLQLLTLQKNLFGYEHCFTKSTSHLHQRLCDNTGGITFSEDVSYHSKVKHPYHANILNDFAPALVYSEKSRRSVSATHSDVMAARQQS